MTLIPETGRHPLVYLAGPDIFYPDQSRRYAGLEALCAAHRLQGLRPSDGDSEPGSNGDPVKPAELAQRIYTGNIAHIRRADAVLANLEPMRNPVEPDSGTVFEVGMAVAWGKPVIGYLPQAGQTLAERVVAAFGEVAGSPAPQASGAAGVAPAWRYDASYQLMIEDLGLPLNLMLACSILGIEPSAEAAVRRLAAHLYRATHH